MKNLEELCKDARIKLGRELQEKEMIFLQWVYRRYVEETQQKNEATMISLTESSPTKW